MYRIFARKLKNKLNSKGGFSLIELMAATVVMVLISSALSVGIPVTLNAYKQATATAEATVLLSTLSLSLTDELRYATDIQLQASDNITLSTFTSSIYGRQIKPISKDGKIQMAYTTVPQGESTPVTIYYPLLSEAIYTNNLAATLNEITYIQGVFNLTLSVYLPADTSPDSANQTLAELEFDVRSVNE